MRLLLITQDFPPSIGGIQTYSWELARRLAGKASTLEVIAPNHVDAASVDRQVPFPVTRISSRPDLLPLSGLPAVLRRARRMKPDVTLHAQWQTVLLSAMARPLTGWPQHIVCAAHGRELLFNPLARIPGARHAYDRLRRWLLGRVDAFLPVSHYTAELLQEHGISPSRLFVVPNGTDPEHFRPCDGDSVRDRLGLADQSVLLTVGRLVPRKGVDTVLRALSQISDTIPDVSYLVVGTGPDRHRLERLAERLHVRDRVHFVGQVSHDDLPSYYSAADLFVMPAREASPDVEGFGIVFLEANACGLPVIGARTGGIPDAIDDGKTGLLVPPADPSSLADAIQRVLTVPGQAETIGQRGRERVVQEASWAHIGDQIYQVLSHVVDSSPLE